MKTTGTGLWSFGRWDWPVSSLYGLGLNFPPEAQDASSYLWQGVGTCAGTSLEGVNPGGAYPRHVRMSPPGGHVLFVDPAGGCGGRTPCFTAIQAAIDDAAPGDVVLVGPGRYVENVRFDGKPILVGAEEGPLVTVIDGHGAGSAVTFADGENLSSVLVGFTVANGLTDQEGGGVRVEGASPQILANLIARNGYCNGGGGIGVGFGSPLVVWNWILQNGPIGCTGGIGGGGISVRGASRPAIIANVIYANAAPVGGGISLSGAGNPVIFDNVIGANAASSEGGGISLGLTSDADIVQNLIAYNSAPRGGGIAALVPFGARGPLLASNTIADNDGPQGSGVFIDGFDNRTMLLNNVIVGAAGQSAIYCGAPPPARPSSGTTTPSGPAGRPTAATAPTRRAGTATSLAIPGSSTPHAGTTGSWPGLPLSTWKQCHSVASADGPSVPPTGGPRGKGSLRHVRVGHGGLRAPGRRRRGRGRLGEYALPGRHRPLARPGPGGLRTVPSGQGGRARPGLRALTRAAGVPGSRAR